MGDFLIKYLLGVVEVWGAVFTAFECLDSGYKTKSSGHNASNPAVWAPNGAWKEMLQNQSTKQSLPYFRLSLDF